MTSAAIPRVEINASKHDLNMLHGSNALEPDQWYSSNSLWTAPWGCIWKWKGSKIFPEWIMFAKRDILKSENWHLRK